MPPEFSWQHILTEAVVSAIPVILTVILAHWLTNRNASKRDRERETKREVLAQEYPIHAHGEDGKDEPLTTAGLRYPRAKVNGR